MLTLIIVIVTLPKYIILKNLILQHYLNMIIQWLKQSNFCDFGISGENVVIDVLCRHILAKKKK